jgi:hypothetical protein
MYVESSSELYSGSADVPVRSLPTGAKYLFLTQTVRRAISRFALIADEGVRAPSRMKRPDSEDCFSTW